MQIDQSIVYEVLAEKGITELYHANSVLTASQFLRAGSLLSKGTVKRAKMFQTVQGSDEIDKEWSVWFDVFTDSVDIHQRASRANVYGPVLFVLDSAIMKEACAGAVWVTKLNPTKWKCTTHEDRWFTSAEDLCEKFVKGQFDQMIVFRHNGGELEFGNYLKEIVLDDPDYMGTDRLDVYSMAKGALTLAKTEGNVDAPIRRRKCIEGCKCVENYKTDVAKMIEMFVP